jgi:hypothetical protein
VGRRADLLKCYLYPGVFPTRGEGGNHLITFSVLTLATFLGNLRFVEISHFSFTICKKANKDRGEAHMLLTLKIQELH